MSACPWVLLLGVEPTDENICKARALVQAKDVSCSHAAKILIAWNPAIKVWHDKQPSRHCAVENIILPEELEAGMRAAFEAGVHKTWADAIDKLEAKDTNLTEEELVEFKRSFRAREEGGL